MRRQPYGAAHRLDRRRARRSRARTPPLPARRAPRARRSPSRLTPARRPRSPSPDTAGRRASDRAELDERVVPLRGRVDHEVGVVDVRRPLASPREDARASGSAARKARAAPSVAEHGRPLCRQAVEDRRVRRVTADPPFLEDERVHRLEVRLRERGSGLLVRVSSRSRRRNPRRRDREPPSRSAPAATSQRDVGPVEPARREGGVLHHRRERVRDRMAEQRDEPRAARDHPTPWAAR